MHDVIISMAAIPGLQPVPAQLPPQLAPNVLDSSGLVDTNWFKVVVTKCPSGRHEGSASVVFDRTHGLWECLPSVFITSALNATSRVPIQELILKRHRLTSLPSNFSTVGQLSASLIVLDLSGNRFTSLPESVCDLVELKELHIGENQLSSLPHQIHQLTKLEFIHLQQNHFKEFPLPLCSLSALTIVNLECNKIQSIPSEIQQLTTLKEMYLKSNCLSRLPLSIVLLCNIEVLHLSDNLLVELPQEFKSLTSLAQLYLAGNRLKMLPKSLSELKSLRGLTVGRNPLQYPPPIVCRQGITAVMKFLKNNDTEQAD